PVYPASEEVTPKKLRELVGAALPRALEDPLPAGVQDGLPTRIDALWALHRPRSLDEAERGRRRLAFDELLLLQVGLARLRRERDTEVAPALAGPGELVARYREVLPFRFTEHQERAIADIVADTHALIQEGVQLDNLAVAVVDEQHRFGVAQRKALTEGRTPHVLHMTATPIPRTLALTVYGTLAVSEISKPPANRKPIITAWVTEARSAAAYNRLRKHLDAGRQAYVVCPLIEESETSQARAAEAEAERLQRAELRSYRVALLHGRLR